MLTRESQRVVDRAKRLYEEKYRQSLEGNHMGPSCALSRSRGIVSSGKHSTTP